jgi:hypothetical protein
MIRRYDLPSTGVGEGWAYIVLDTDIGFFAAVSDFGNYAYAWSQPGCEFRKFLIGCDTSYLSGKLLHGRGDRQVYDQEGTLKAIEEVGLTTHGRSLDTEHEFYDWARESKDDGAFRLYVTKTNPECIAFCERVMPRFKELIRAELAAEHPTERDNRMTEQKSKEETGTEFKTFTQEFVGLHEKQMSELNEVLMRTNKNMSDSIEKQLAENKETLEILKAMQPKKVVFTELPGEDDTCNGEGDWAVTVNGEVKFVIRSEDMSLSSFSLRPLWDALNLTVTFESSYRP